MQKPIPIISMLVILLLSACADDVIKSSKVIYSKVDNPFPSVSTGITMKGSISVGNPFPTKHTNILIAGDLTTESRFPIVETGISVRHPFH